MRRFSIFLLAGLLMVAMTGYADDIDMIEDEEPVIPMVADDVPGLQALTPTIILDDRSLADADVFGFQPEGDIVPDTDTVIIFSWAEEGGWGGGARGLVSKYDRDGNLLGTASITDNNEPLGHSSGGCLAAFSDGGFVCAFDAQFGFEEAPAAVFEGRPSAYRVFDANMQPTTPIMSAWEMDKQPGTDDRDNAADLGNSNITRLTNDRFVIVDHKTSANLNIQAGIEDTGEAPGSKAWYRVFERDGTPVGPTQVAFDSPWSGGHGDPDVVAGPDGTFAITAEIASFLENGDGNPIQMFDNDGNRIGEPFGVVDPRLVEIGVTGPGIAHGRLGYGGGIWVLGANLRLTDTNTIGLTHFDGDGNILRSTYDGLKHKFYVPEVREGDIDVDPSGNVIVCDRSSQAIPETGGDEDEIQFIMLHTYEGVAWGPSFLTYPPQDNTGSQRDPTVIINESIFVVMSLSNDPEVNNPHGGLNVFRIYANPMEQVDVSTWMIF